ncbi:hypothetical protein EVG20_g8051 [Dentipellis fragilis]|uniref:Uncharacterized protein n=1 Tax=Dentipellis fragilis TaxID=205917 RepID=A0A4Y9Y858_9AGAM|nr:hypothetical protein EVG20_g8051 [Dentipellis fragilis]
MLAPAEPTLTTACFSHVPHPRLSALSSACTFRDYHQRASASRLCRATRPTGRPRRRSRDNRQATGHGPPPEPSVNATPQPQLVPPDR